MDNRPTEKRINSQHDLIRTQAEIIAAEIQKRIRRGYFIEDLDDLDGFVNGITQFRGELVAMESYLKELGCK